MKAGNTNTGSSSIRHPELVALAAANVPEETRGFLMLAQAAESTQFSWLNADSKSAGVDISAAALRIAEKRAKKAHVRSWIGSEEAFWSLPIEDETFDFITDRGLFHLIEDHDRPRYASEAFSRIKKRRTNS